MIDLGKVYPKFRSDLLTRTSHDAEKQESACEASVVAREVPAPRSDGIKQQE
ncbi:MAG TPA: hypothetical protein PLU72_02915 [Candidatus Ozemobacteraceae bacterium]|nr:hypothetical protein [Candidatus Ozemobacteraceae bacterium]